MLLGRVVAYVFKEDVEEVLCGGALEALTNHRTRKGSSLIYTSYLACVCYLRGRLRIFLKKTLRRCSAAVHSRP